LTPRAPGLLREFRWPYRWLALWGLMLATVIATSLLPARDLPPTPFSGFDKVEHLLAYAVLSAYAVMLFPRVRTQALVAAGLIALGVGLEFAQATLTDSRQADSADALANALGALAGLLIGPTPLADGLLRLEARRSARDSHHKAKKLP
jgi:VanZ family protein